MVADATLAVVVGIGGYRAVLALVGVMLCYAAQRQGREAEYELRSVGYRFRYRCGALSTARPTHLRAVPDATDETVGEHHIPSTSEASPASLASDSRRLGSRHT
jgi:hypothetical protein